MRSAIVVGVALVAALGATSAPAAAVPAAAPQPRVQAAQTITFDRLPNEKVGAPAFNVSATTTAFDPIQGTASGSASNDNTCPSTLVPTLSSFPDRTEMLTVSLGGAASPTPHFGDPIALTNTSITVTVPSALYLVAYESGLVADAQEIPVTIGATVAGSDSVEHSHTYASVQTFVTVHIHDPNGVPRSGDETIDPLTTTAPLPDTIWHPATTAPVYFSQGSVVIGSSFSSGATSWNYTQRCTSTATPNPYVWVFGTGPVTMLPISFSALTNSVCFMLGSAVLVFNAGVCTIEATQAGDENWAAATPVDQSFVVGYGISRLSPPSNSRFTPGSTIPVTFQLTDSNGQPIADDLAAHLGCTVSVTFTGSRPVCAAYHAATRLFAASVKTPAQLTGGKAYPIVVRVVVGPTTVASATVVAVTPVTVRSVARTGYWMLGADGKVYAFGNAPNLGGAPGSEVAMTGRADGNGYWVVDAVGNVSHFGRAIGFGGHPALRAGERVSTISATPSGNGYWLFTNRGRAFAYGGARFFGDMSAATLNGPIIASVATADGRGYYMVGSDGGVFSFGDARFHGSTGNLHLNRPVVGISPTPDNRGYWLVASDGGVFAFAAPFRGSMGAVRLNKPVNGLVAYGNGYLMVASDGGIFDLSNKPFAGSLAADPPAAPIIGVAAFST